MLNKTFNKTMDSRISFQPLRLEHLIDALAVEKDAYEFPWSRTNFLDCLTSGYDCWMMRRHQVHLGHGVIAVGAGEAHLLNITIGRSFQHQGLGRKLLCFMLERARTLKAERMFLEVRESNQIAFDLYLSEGFNEVGRRRGYYPGRKTREDALIMAQEL